MGAPEAMIASPPVLYDLDGSAEVIFGPRLQPLIMGVRPNQTDPRKQEMEIAEQKHAPNFVMEVGGVNLDLENVPFRIDKCLPLAS